MHFDVANDIMWLKVWLRMNVTKEIVVGTCPLLRCYTVHRTQCEYVSTNIELLLYCLMANIVVETNFEYIFFFFCFVLCVYIIHTFQIDRGWYLCEHSTQKDINEHMHHTLFDFSRFSIFTSLHQGAQLSSRRCFKSIHFQCL